MHLMKNFEKAAFAFAAVATLAAVFVSSDAKAAGYVVNAKAYTANFPHWDRLNMRAWPSSSSAVQYSIARDRTVVVERCILKSGSDWCLIHQAGKAWKQGWVNGKYIVTGGHSFATPHPYGHGWH